MYVPTYIHYEIFRRKREKDEIFCLNMGEWSLVLLRSDLFLRRPRRSQLYSLLVFSWIYFNLLPICWDARNYCIQKNFLHDCLEVISDNGTHSENWMKVNTLNALRHDIIFISACEGLKWKPFTDISVSYERWLSNGMQINVLGLLVFFSSN